MRFRVVRPGAILVSVLAVACASAPAPGDAGYPYNATGAYAGVLVVDDQRFGAELELRTAPGGAVSGSFRVGPPFEIDGRAIGVVIDDLLRLTVTYRSDARGACSGQIEGILTVEAGGDVIEGPVTIADCGDPVPGRMSFRR